MTGVQTCALPIFTEGWYWDFNDSNRKFAERFMKEFKGKAPTSVQAGVYSATMQYLKAIEATKTGAAYASDAAFEDMVFLTQCGVLQIDHNNKTIVEQPTGLTPGNYGFAGVANVDYAAGTGSQSVTIVGSSGLAQTFGNRAFMLKPNEQFEVKITYPQVRQSGGSTTMQAQKGRYLTVILDGQSIRARR